MAVGEVLAVADGLAVGDGFLVGVGFANLLGPALVVGLDEVLGCTATTLGVGVGVGAEGRPAVREGVTLGEFERWPVVLPAFPLAWPAM